MIVAEMQNTDLRDSFVGPIFSLRIAEEAEYMENLFDSFVGCLNLSELNVCLELFGSGKQLAWLSVSLELLKTFSNVVFRSGTTAIRSVERPITIRKENAMVNQK